MQPDSIPLISARVNSALSGPSATPVPTTEAPATPPDSQRLQAAVVDARPAQDGTRLTLSVDGQTLSVTSKIPLPPGTQVTLLLSTRNGKPVLNVEDFRLPAGNSPALPQTPAASGLPREPQQAVAQLLMSRLQLLPQAPVVKTGTPLYTAAGLAGSANSAAARPMPSAPYLTTSAAPALSAANATPAADLQPLARLMNILARPAATATTATANTAEPLPDPAPSASQPATALSTAPAGGDIPQAVRTILTQWLQQLPAPAGLSTAPGVEQALRNSGLSYEQKLFAVAEQIRNEPAPGNTTLAATKYSQSTAGNAQTTPTTPSAPASAAAQPNRDNLPDLLRNLWSKAGLLTDKALQAGSVQTTAGNAQPASPAANPGVTLEAALEATRAKLETPGTALHPALNTLLTQDHKAVISRALLSWLNQHRQPDSPAQRELPLSFSSSDDLPETFRLLQSALARTETEQISRLQHGPEQPLSIPLFCREQDQLREVRLQIQQETGTAKHEQKKTINWQLRLHFDLQQLGPLDVELNLSLPRLSATFWSEQQPTLAALNQALAPLRSTLTGLGVEVSELQARFGQLPETTRNHISQRLVDIHS